jgi:hypothetical protein
MMTQALVLYDQMRTAIAECAAIDEAAGIRDISARLLAYAKIRDDYESRQRFAEIRLRACQRIGELSRDLEKALPNKGHGADLPADGKTKETQLAEVGISTSAANRYEELAGPKEQQAAAVISAATDSYFAKLEETKEEASFNGLRSAVKEALRENFGIQKTTRTHSEPKAPDYLVSFLYSPRQALREECFDPNQLADDIFEELVPEALEACELYQKLLHAFIERLKERFPDLCH